MLITLQVKGFKCSSRKQGATNKQETLRRAAGRLTFKTEKGGLYLLCKCFLSSFLSFQFFTNSDSWCSLWC